MASKKALYRPAADLLDHKSSGNLAQGNSSSAKTVKIKQGMLEPHARTEIKRLTSTMKPTKQPIQERKNPIVVCHDPTIIRSRIKPATAVRDTGITPDAITSTTVINIKQNDIEVKSDAKKHGRKVYHVKSKYKTNGTKTLVENKSSLNPGQYSFNGSLPDQKLQKTSTPSLKEHKDLFWNESAISGQDATLFASSEKQDTGNSSLLSQNLDGAEDIEVLHRRYLQAKHLELKGKYHQQQRAEQVSLQLSFLHDKNNEASKELESLEDEVSELEHLYNLKCQVEAQKRSLAAPIDKLQHAKDQYHILCENLDTIRHHMPLTDIHEPDTLELEKALDEARNLIGQINILTKSKAMQIHQAADAGKKLSQTCLQEAADIPEVENSTADMLTLVLESGSLVAQLNS